MITKTLSNKRKEPIPVGDENPFAVEQILASMIILHDTREQDTERARKRYQRFGMPVESAILDYGDYAYNARLPDGTWLYDTRKRIYPCCIIERKMSLDELEMCLTRGRKRFSAEFERAKAAGARIILLVENASWENLNAGRYRSGMLPQAFRASLTAFMVRYDLQLIFCKEETSPILIRELLYRDLKNRLETGTLEVRPAGGIPQD